MTRSIIRLYRKYLGTQMNADSKRKKSAFSAFFSVQQRFELITDKVYFNTLNTFETFDKPRLSNLITAFVKLSIASKNSCNACTRL